MLPRHLRLRHPKDFAAVRERGKHWRDHLVSINVLPNGLPHCRFGFVVSRSIGSTVRRNRVKRRLRAVVRSWLPAVQGGYDVVVIAHGAIATVSYSEIKAALGRLLRRAGVLKDNEVL